MPSVVCTGHEYLGRSQEIEARGPFKYRLLAEGDSWMDRSSLVIPSLPWFLAQEMDNRGLPVLIINLAIAGSELRQLVDIMKGEFVWWLGQFRYDAILLSAGGNDFIDAARDPDPGQGLLLNMAGQPLPADGYACVSQAAKGILEDYLNTDFKQLVDAIRADANNQSTPVFLNCYDTPVARNAPAGPGIGPWLYKAYQKNSIDPSLWPALTQGLFQDIGSVIQGWTGFDGALHAVPTTGVLDAADPASGGSSGDWANEIHPNASGWTKEARIWAGTLVQVLGT
ncbi:SGNH/GDSL hydrolase family protein [Roseateles saccharophilus]|uniref:GDSL-like lipase/acylhydrolase family protein n=2 Tax=Roseateles saccharophilus TaxID=304 RepID=A0A4R3U8V0_ROSSA|nr:SGNH/GDSL hydrolase family protein [Roseateles saccharophilus]TCU84463.1 hypothetical protein EV671_10539 [Roseateles saccharophilus]